MRSSGSANSATGWIPTWRSDAGKHGTTGKEPLKGSGVSWVDPCRVWPETWKKVRIKYRRMKSAIITAAAALAAACTACNQTDYSNAGDPNIILVMSDDQGYGQVGYYGHPTLETPNLDAMAENGLRLDRFYAGAPVCSPTRASVLTGRANDRTGVPSHGHALRLQEKTIAEALQAEGYATGHFGKWHLNALRGPGVPIFKDDPNGPAGFGFDMWVSVTNFFDLDPLMSDQGEFKALEGTSSEVIVDQAVQFIR